METIAFGLATVALVPVAATAIAWGAILAFVVLRGLVGR